VTATRQPHRPPLAADALADALLPGSRLLTAVRVVARTGSTNADLLAAARAGTAAGTVLVAEEQTAGRGRLDRSWHSQPGAALTFSVLLRPAAIPPSARGWLPLLTGVAVAAALRAQTGLDVSLKWPNDVLVSGAEPGMAGKLAGILAEQAGDAIVVGIGLNVSARRDELPAPQATSLLLAGAAGQLNPDVPADRRAGSQVLGPEAGRECVARRIGARPPQVPVLKLPQRRDQDRLPVRFGGACQQQ
jgi:BirA family biotin operon repressor/biotin-[acetyl-CoA-carboxylase] ligase